MMMVIDRYIDIVTTDRFGIFINDFIRSFNDTRNKNNAGNGPKTPTLTQVMQHPLTLQTEMLKFLSQKMVSPSDITTEFKPIATCCDGLVDCLMNQLELGDVDITTQVREATYNIPN